MSTLIQDLRYAIRMLMRNPAFTAVAVLTLALGIGATTAIFTVFYAVLLRPLPYPHPDELVYIKENLGPPTGTVPFAFSRDLAAWRNRTRTLSQLGAYMYSWGNLTGGGEAARVNCGVATSSFFALLGARAGWAGFPPRRRPSRRATGSDPQSRFLETAVWRRSFRRRQRADPRWQNL